MHSSRVYQPLQRSTNFRVLQLEPGTEGSDLHFSLTEHDVLDDEEEEGKYFALSYVWGEPDFHHQIFSPQGSIAVTASLFGALQRYRHDTEPIRLWVDALAINQSDPDERASQILLMHLIYSRCQLVLIWLGEGSPALQRAVEYVTNTFNILLPTLANPDNSTSDFRSALDELQGLQNDSYIQDLCELFENPWFLRAWTYQEIFSASNAIFSCGMQSFDSTFLFNLAIIWVRYVPRALWGSVAAIEAISQMSLCRYNQERYFEQSNGYSFIDLVSVVRLRQCKDPRDKIYCVLGLADQNPLPYLPSYLIDTDQLYCDFAIQTMIVSKSLNIFKNCIQTESESRLPSWVPDWRLRKNPPSAIDLHDQIFSASGWRCAEPHLSKDRTTLSLHGMIVDEVMRLSSNTHLGDTRAWESEEQRWASLFTEQYRLVKESAEIAVQSMRSHADGQTDAYWRAFICDQDDEALRATPIWKDRVKTYRKLLLETGGDWTNWAASRSTDDEWLSTIEAEKRFVHVATGRRFCLTKNGRLGWVSEQARVGDVVSILFGSTVPVLLRPVSDAFRLMGQCYIHGIMDGEAVDGSITLEERVIELI